MVPESTMMVYLLCGVVEILVMVGWFTYYWGCLAFGDLSNQSIRAGVVTATLNSITRVGIG